MKSAPRRAGLWLVILGFSTSCAAAGIGSPGRSEDRAARTSEREIDRSEFRFLWPFAIHSDECPQNDRERIFSVAVGCDSAKEPVRCRTSVRGQYGLAEAELEQILVEGHERTWPPIPPRRRSVEPIVEAGLRLCQ